ncbi:hypothetical protein RINTHH_10780 [Richelia intracellularis HH01]|uniref:Uncharacterized protein n=1 Tax=Richelia intracellularis HH01 TaxID=1165094 RepID=M1X025_9NOST|nr:hypothetical protein RINTHH_10780 [Richelia intracellularis HH01]
MIKHGEKLSGNCYCAEQISILFLPYNVITYFKEPPSKIPIYIVVVTIKNVDVNTWYTFPGKNHL